MQVPLVRRIPHTWYHINNLRTDRNYKFRVQAENEFGVSKPTLPANLYHTGICISLLLPVNLYHTGIYISLLLPANLYHTGIYISLLLPVNLYHTGIYISLLLPTNLYHTDIYISLLFITCQSLSYRYLHIIIVHKQSSFTLDLFILSIVAKIELYSIAMTVILVSILRRSDAITINFSVCHFVPEYRSPIEAPEIYDYDRKSSALSLEWKPRAIAPYHTTPTKYHIESWEPRRRSWNRIASNIETTRHRLTGVPTDYDNLFRIRAEAQNVLSEPSYPVSLARYSRKLVVC